MWLYVNRWFLPLFAGILWNCKKNFFLSMNKFEWCTGFQRKELENMHVNWCKFLTQVMQCAYNMKKDLQHSLMLVFIQQKITNGVHFLLKFPLMLFIHFNLKTGKCNICIMKHWYEKTFYNQWFVMPAHSCAAVKLETCR